MADLTTLRQDLTCQAVGYALGLELDNPELSAETRQLIERTFLDARCRVDAQFAVETENIWDGYQHAPMHVERLVDRIEYVNKL
jgi:hypothetical protein